MPHMTSFGSTGLALSLFFLLKCLPRASELIWPFLTPCLPPAEGKAQCMTVSQRNIWDGGAPPDQFRGSAVM